MIAIIDHYSQAPGEKANNRFLTIANMLTAVGKEVEIITTDFAHIPKKHRHIDLAEFEKLPYHYTMLHEPGYAKNVSIKRIYSHYLFGRRLRKYLSDRNDIEAVYIAVPSLDVGREAARYCKKNKVPLIIDIQDIWPEAFRLVFNVPIVSDVLFYPMKRSADHIYGSADDIVAVSDTYLQRGLRANNKGLKGHCVFLGTRLDEFDKNASKDAVISKKQDEVWLGYCGTLGSSYDLTVVIDALALLQDQGKKGPRFIIMGDGPCMQEFKQYAALKNVRAEFLGRLEYGTMCSVLKRCDIAVNPIKKGAAQSIINKHGDYAAAGIPVVSTQENIEYQTLVERYNMGFNIRNGSVHELAEKILLLQENEELRKQMGLNARRCAEELFDRNRSYIEIVDTIVGLSSKVVN